MTKVPLMKATEIAKVLHKLGFEFKRQKGSHMFFEHADPANASFAVQPTRYDNGELQYPDEASNGETIVRLGIVLPEQWEKESALTKWLYRRGPQFIDNFEIILDGYKKSDNVDDFIARVLNDIHGPTVAENTMKSYKASKRD